MSSSFPVARFPGLPIVNDKAAEDSLFKERAAPAQEPSDELLLTRISVGDEEALGILFRRYARTVWSIGRRVLRNNEESDDLLQDVFLFIRGKASAFDSSKGPARSLIIHITYQRAISRRRYLTSRRFYSAEDLEDERVNLIPAPTTPLYDESLEAYLGREGLVKAVAELSLEQRETLRLYFFEGYSLEEIAEHMGHSFGNVRHYYYRGLEKLRKQLPKRATDP
jgi:RNA polymerase sigma-70 factor, ECF subfamily